MNEKELALREKIINQEAEDRHP